MEELEKRILTSREAMDIHEPGSDLWNRIERELPHRRVTGRTFLFRAASVLIIAAAGFTALLVLRDSGRTNPATTLVNETELYYNSIINTLYSEAKPLLTVYPDVSNELNSGMNELDSLSREIKEDLKDNVANSEVIEALIRNYRLRIELLEDMLAIMKEKEMEETNEKQNASKL